MTRGDLLAIAVVAALVGVLYARYWQPPVPAAQFEVRVAGERVAHRALDENGELRIDGRLGASVLRVAEGRVRFIAGPCRNKVCVHSGWLAHAGDTAACLPNRVSISLRGESGDSLDGVSF